MALLLLLLLLMFILLSVGVEHFSNFLEAASSAAAPEVHVETYDTAKEQRKFKLICNLYSGSESYYLCINKAFSALLC